MGGDRAATAVTSPLAFTVAAAGLPDVHVTVRPVRMLPIASLSVVVSCWVAPTARLALAGLTATEATSAGGGAVVAPVTFESPPNTALTLSVPRNGTNWNWWLVLRRRASTCRPRWTPNP